MKKHLRQIYLPDIVPAAIFETGAKLAYRIAHDLGNLTAAVSGNAELISRGAEESSPAHRRAGNIIAACDQAQHFARHMEMFLGQSARDDIQFNADAFFGERELADIRQKLSRETDWSVEKDDKSPLPAPFVSASRIRHCVVVLLENAADAMVDRRGGVFLRIAAATLDAGDLGRLLRHKQPAAGDFLELAVEDAGEGVLDEVVPFMFAPAFSTRMRRQGFGLSDVYGIICKQHGGAIGLWTTPELGARVSLYIPANRPRPTSLFDR